MPGPGPTIPVPLQTRDNRRRAERFGVEMPVSVDGRAGTTQDLSSSGLSFVSEQPYEPGAHVEVVIEYLLDGHQYPLRCDAEVVRVEPCEGGYRVGARLSPNSQLEDISVAGEAMEPVPAPGRQHLRRVD